MKTRFTPKQQKLIKNAKDLAEEAKRKGWKKLPEDLIQLNANLKIKL